MIKGIRKYKKFDLAHTQLKTAMMLYMAGANKYSIITLAGAANIILNELVRREGGKNFSEFEAEKHGDISKYKKIGMEINNALYVNAFKHMDPKDDDFIMVNDLDECALGMILISISNYKQLQERDKVLVAVFMDWLKKNVNLEKYIDPNL